LAELQKAARFERALLPHLDAAHNLARWLLGNAQDAEDAVQDAFVRALTFFDGFHGEDGRGWLLAIIRNTCYDFLRKNRRADQARNAEEELALTPDNGLTPEAEHIRNADARLVRDGIDSLPAEYREVLVLRELEGLSYKEIAHVAGVPMGTVMSRLARARQRLECELRDKR